MNTNLEPSAAANAPDAEIATRRARVQRAAQRAQRAVMTILVLTCLLGVAMVAASYRAYQSQRRAEQAEAQSAERSWHAFLAQARAERLSAQAGHRANALAALSNAAAIRPSVELRDEALASFALRDVEKEVAWPLQRGAFGFYFDAGLQHYIVGYTPGDVSMFRLADNAPVRTFRAADAGLGTNAVARSAIFSPTGRYVVVPYVRGEIVLWERDTGRLAHLFGRGPQPEQLAWRPTFSADDRTLCARSAVRSNMVLFVDLPTGLRREIEIPGVNDTVRMNNQGDTLVWTRRTELFFHDARTGALQKTIPWPANVLQFRWDAQGERLSVWCGDGTLNLLEVKTGRVRQLGGKLVGPWVQHFSPDGSMLATSGNDGTSRLWDVPEARLIAQTSEARAFVWGDDSERIAFAIPGQQVGVWRITRPRGYRVWQATSDTGSTVWDQDMSADGRWMVMTPVMLGTNRVIELFPLQTGGSALLIPGEGRVRAGFHPTEPRLVVASKGELLSYRLPEQETNRAIQISPPEKISLPGNVAVQMFSFSANGKFAAVVDARSRLLLVDLLHSNQVTVLAGTAPVVGQAGPASITGSGALAISRDGRWIAMGRNNRDTKVTVWDTTTGQVARQFGNDASHVAFSPDGRWLIAVGSRSCTLSEVGTWKTIWTRPRPPLVAMVGAAAFTADGSMLAYTDSVDSIEIVEPATGRHLANVSSPTSLEIAGLRFSADGRTLAAPAAQGRIHTWDLTALRSELRQLGLDWPLAAPPAVTSGTLTATPLLVSGAGLGIVALVGALGMVALRRHGRLTREFVETMETSARLHESERAAQLALEQEKELSRLKSQFVTTVSHEFRTPLGVIMSSAENLHDYHERLRACLKKKSAQIT